MLHAQKYENHNDRPWVVFIHGAGGSIKTWKRQIDFFTEFYNVLSIDLRDHGKSKNIQPEYNKYSFKVISEDIKKTLDYQQIENAHFITLSFGSVLMQDFAKRYPNYVNKVVFAGAVFSGGLLLRSFVYTARFLNLFLSYFQMYRLFSYILMPKKQNQFARRLYISQAKLISPKEYMKWIGLYHEFFKLLKSFNQNPPGFHSQIIMGSNDSLFLNSARKFSLRHKNIRLDEIPETGHIVNIERADEFNQLALNFLENRK